MKSLFYIRGHHRHVIYRSAWMTALGFMLTIALMEAHALSAQDVVQVTVEATAPLAAGDPTHARKQALETAERKAVAEALAPQITVETLLVNLRLAGTIAGAIPYGRIVTKQILEEGPVETQKGASIGQNPLYRVRISAGVVEETSGEDPSFHLDAALNQSIFKDGDELEIHVRATKDCYFTMFNIVEGDKIIRLLPNDLSKKNFLPADTHITFPGTDERRHGLRLQAYLPKHKQSTTESIYILALPHPFELGSIKTQEGIFGVYDGHTAFLKDLIREVVNIPLADRAETLLQYKIRKTGRGL
jgi:hypothetical protein